MTTPSANVLVVFGADAPHEPQWSGPNHVVAHGARGLYRLAVPTASAQLLPFESPIEAVSADRRTDWTAVLTENGTLHVLRDGARERTIAVGESKGGRRSLQLSETGGIVLVGGASGGSLYDVGTGALRGSVKGEHATLDPTGKYVAASTGVFAIDGSLIESWRRSAQPTWVGSRVVFSDEATVFTFDVETKKKTTAKIGCARRPFGLAQTVDVELARVVVDCDDHVVFLSVVDTGRIDVPVPTEHRFEADDGGRSEAPPPRPARTGVDVFLDRGERDVRVDPTTRSVSLEKEYALRRVAPHTTRVRCRVLTHADEPSECDEIESHGGTWSLVATNGGIAIVEARSGNERMRLGVLSRNEYTLHTRTRAGGLDVLAKSPLNEAEVLRIGPPTRRVDPLDGGPDWTPMDGGVASPAGAKARVYAWPKNAVVAFEDGAVEFFGKDAAAAVVCIVETNLFPVEACPGLRIMTGRFRVD